MPSYKLTSGATGRWFFPLVVVLSVLLATWLPTVAAEDLRVLQPIAGDTVTAGTSVDIRWANNSSGDITISLYEEEPVGNRLLVTILASNVANKGSFDWTIRSTYTSGCNYQIELRAGGEVAVGGFFTILNQAYGGLPANATCASNSSGATSRPSRAEGGTSASVVSPATLGGVVGATVAAILLLEALMVWIGRKRGWFVSQAVIASVVRQEREHDLGRMNHGVVYTPVPLSEAGDGKVIGERAQLP